MSALHTRYNYHQNDMSCRTRLENLVERAGFFLDGDIRFPARANMPACIHWDHVTILTDVEGHVFFMNEPYNVSDHEADLIASGMAWFRVPEKYAPYGNGTSTYLITFPWLRNALNDIKSRLGVPFNRTSAPDLDPDL